MIVDWKRWAGLDSGDAGAVVAAIAARSGAEPLAVRAYEYAGRTGLIATFRLGGERYAFVPGGEVILGFDGHQFAPTPQQAESFADSADEYGIEQDIRQFTDAYTSAARTVVVPPLLVAVDAAEAGAVAVPVDHPDIVRRVERLRQRPRHPLEPPPVESEWSGAARVRLRPDWTVEAAWLVERPPYDDEVARLAGTGRRLLTPDEWEHACGAGATTLFRWGDDNPGGDPWSARTGPHRGPNRFGLHIGQDPYREERTAVRDVVCGGDGGKIVCGGAGSFLSWLTIATAYRDPHYGAPLDDSSLLVRPAIPLD